METKEPPVHATPESIAEGDVQPLARPGRYHLPAGVVEHYQPLQRRTVTPAGLSDPAAMHAQGARGVAGAGETLPHRDAIQRSFGHHDVGEVRAHVGGKAADAARAIGAEAYATGHDVAFQKTPDLHTAAHEAAHVVQQRAGVHLKGGVDEGDDEYERHADAVADLVVRGQSAQALLDEKSRGTPASPGLQRRSIKCANGEEIDTQTLNKAAMLSKIEEAVAADDKQAEIRLRGALGCGDYKGGRPRERSPRRFHDDDSDRDRDSGSGSESDRDSGSDSEDDGGHDDADDGVARAHPSQLRSVTPTRLDRDRDRKRPRRVLAPYVQSSQSQEERNPFLSGSDNGSGPSPQDDAKNPFLMSTPVQQLPFPSQTQQQTVGPSGNNASLLQSGSLALLGLDQAPTESLSLQLPNPSAGNWSGSAASSNGSGESKAQQSRGFFDEDYPVPLGQIDFGKHGDSDDETIDESFVGKANGDSKQQPSQRPQRMPQDKQRPEILNQLEKSEYIATQCQLDNDKCISRWLIFGRPPTEHGSKQEDHITAWAMVLLKLRRATKGRTVSQAMEIVLAHIVNWVPGVDENACKRLAEEALEGEPDQNRLQNLVRAYLFIRNAKDGATFLKKSAKGFKKARAAGSGERKGKGMISKLTASSNMSQALDAVWMLIDFDVRVKEYAKLGNAEKVEKLADAIATHLMETFQGIPEFCDGRSVELIERFCAHFFSNQAGNVPKDIAQKATLRVKELLVLEIADGDEESEESDDGEA